MNYISNDHPDFLAYKEALLAQCSNISPLYQSLHLEYYQYYYEHTFIDDSFCIEIGKQALLLVMITKAVDNKLSYYNLPIKLIWLETISDTQKKGALKVAIKQLQTMQKHSEASLYYQESLLGSLSEFSLSLLKSGYHAQYSFNQVINLTLPKEQLLTDVRKVYRANIRWGEKKLTFKTLNHENCQKGNIEPFHQLHIQVSGRETRNNLSWQVQEKMIQAGQAFAIYGYLEHQLVSAGFFIYNDHECYYGVGAYQRELFDKPISHVSVWQAILLAQQLGCQRFVMGETFFSSSKSNQIQTITEKERSISHFKQGFGGEVYTQLTLSN